MKSILKKIYEENKQLQEQESEAIQNEINNPATTDNRRNFLKKSAMGGITLAGMAG